jgi:hypothetical protein
VRFDQLGEGQQHLSQFRLAGQLVRPRPIVALAQPLQLVPQTLVFQRQAVAAPGLLLPFQLSRLPFAVQ